MPIAYAIGKNKQYRNMTGSVVREQNVFQPLNKIGDLCTGGVVVAVLESQLTVSYPVFGIGKFV